MSDKKTLTTTQSITSLAGATSKTVSSVVAYTAGCVNVVELNWSDSTQSFIKFRGVECEVGGTNEFGTGTKLRS